MKDELCSVSSMNSCHTASVTPSGSIPRPEQNLPRELKLIRASWPAFVDLAGRRHRILRIILAGGGGAHGCPQRHSHRSAVAYQRGMGERLQEIEGDRKQRRGECRCAPTRNRSSAVHGVNKARKQPERKRQVVAGNLCGRFQREQGSWTLALKVAEAKSRSIRSVGMANTAQIAARKRTTARIPMSAACARSASERW